MFNAFYNCERCGWSGNQLAYIGFDIDNKGVKRTQHLYGKGQGVCPECGEPFDGCVHTSLYDQLTCHHHTLDQE